MFAIVEESIDQAALLAHVSDPAAGAVTSFLGTTRATNRGRRVERLEYEAYAEMAVAEFEKIAAEAARRWEVVRVAIVHRVGVVPLGEASVGIAVSAPHRRESIEACHYCIDALKLVAPIWKKEFFEGGEVWIGSLADCDHGDEPHGHGHAAHGHAHAADSDGAHGHRTQGEAPTSRGSGSSTGK
jgi:molybdopterin synthase catalytic subunit